MDVKTRPGNAKNSKILNLALSLTEFDGVKKGETLTQIVDGDEGKKAKILVALLKDSDKDYGCNVTFEGEKDSDLYQIKIPLFQIEKAISEGHKLMLARKDPSVKDLKTLGYVDLIYRK